MPTIRNTIPRPSEQPLEVDYLQNRQDQYPNNQVDFDVKKQQFVPQACHPGMHQVSFELIDTKEYELQAARANESFLKAVESLKKKKGKHDQVIADFNFENAHDWKDVNQIIELAEKSYLAEETIAGKIRKLFRKVGDNGKSIQSFVGLLPEGNYKTLCGGLTLILSAMIGHSEIRTKIKELIEELPEDIQIFEDYSSIYQESKILRRHIEQVYVEVLKGLEYIVTWYAEGTKKHIKDALLKNQSYAKQFDDQIRNIKQSWHNFQKITQAFLHKRAKSIHEGVTRIECAVEDAKKGVQDVGNTMMRHMSGLKVEMLNGLQNVLADQTNNAKWQKQIDALKKEATDKDKLIAELRDRVNEVSYTPVSLAEALELEPLADSYTDDLDLAYSKGLVTASRFQHRARCVAESLEFVGWIDSDSSGILVVQGNSEVESLSSTSFLVTLLHQKLVTSDNVLALPFFCGLHTGSRLHNSAEPSGPVLMARSLLAQLLNITTIDWTKGNKGLPFLSPTPEDIRKMKAGSFSTYLNIIRHLIAALRNHHRAIFVLIDGIDYYDLKWKKQVKRMAKDLSTIMAADEASTGVLKVMFAAATHTSDWTKVSEDIVLLDLPEETDGNRDTFERLDSE